MSDFDFDVVTDAPRPRPRSAATQPRRPAQQVTAQAGMAAPSGERAGERDRADSPPDAPADVGG